MTWSNDKTYAIEHQFREGGRYERLSGGYKLVEAMHRYNYCLARSRGQRFNRTLTGIRLVCEQMEGKEAVIQCVDLAEERRAKRKAKLEAMGGAEGVLDATVKRMTG